MEFKNITELIETKYNNTKPNKTKQNKTYKNKIKKEDAILTFDVHSEPNRRISSDSSHIFCSHVERKYTE